jgi:hypothetical protein
VQRHDSLVATFAVHHDKDGRLAGIEYVLPGQSCYLLAPKALEGG